jgi:GST-like protein
LFESGAILLYLAAKTGKLLPKTDRQKFEVLQWLMFQMGGVGPILGQAHHFRIYAPEKIDYAVNHYTNEARRLYGVMNRQLSRHGTSRVMHIRLRISRFFPGCAAGKTRALIGRIIPRSKRGSTRLNNGLR